MIGRAFRAMQAPRWVRVMGWLCLSGTTGFFAVVSLYSCGYFAFAHSRPIFEIITGQNKIFMVTMSFLLGVSNSVLAVIAAKSAVKARLSW